MENKVLKLTILNKEVIVQVISMDKSLYLNVGEGSLSLSSLFLSIPTKFDPIPQIQQILPIENKPEWHVTETETFAKSLSKKLNTVVYASIDLSFKEDLDAIGFYSELRAKLIEALVNPNSIPK